MSGSSHCPPRRLADPMEGFTGTDRFRLVALLGRGSMGVVYRVHDVETDTDVALKTLGAREPEQLYQLKQEFRSLGGILHPNLVELYELVVDEREGFFTMELIDGVDFVEYVRARTGQVDLTCLLDAARQLVKGLAAVHAAGKLHRDIKPSNILVSREGRVVLLDFGLATALGLNGVQNEDSSVGGTFAYMAPEQAWGQPPHPAADWYSAGVVLYESLTGQLPFTGPPARVLQQKTKSAPPMPSTLVPGVPVDLDALVAALLHPDPTRRPGAAEILERLDRTTPGFEVQCSTAGRGSVASRRLPTPSPQPLAPGSTAPFVGRAAELAKLESVFRQVRQGEAAVVHILGPSGIGKSELVRRFLSLVEAEGQVVALHGRCHPQESVPYKALDRLVDALSRVLLSLPESEMVALAPSHVSALTQLFPVLARVPVLEGRDQRDDAAEPHEVRRRGFGALRELLGRLAARQPLILWIDDLQWGDLDSAALLRELLRPPDAPAMLVLLSYRSEDRAHVPLPEVMEGEPRQQWIHEMQLGPLEAAETRELAQRLCAAQVEADHRIAEIVAESAGSPFFVGELARWLVEEKRRGSPMSPRAGRGEGAGMSGNPTLDPLRLADIMDERFRQLSGSAREVLEVVSVAGGPLLRSVALGAAGVGEQGRPIVHALEQRHLLRTTALNDQAAVEVYHDRIREALVAQLASDRLRTVHRHIAETLRLRHEADPHTLFTHYLGAGDTTQAGHYAVLAADGAAKALAFDRAVQLYRQALELRGEVAERPFLVVKLAEALANSGRGADAAAAFESAADALSERSWESRRVLDLQRRSAELYVRTGHLGQGIAVTRAVLNAVGVSYPASPGKALAAALFTRGRLWWRGLRFQPRRSGEMDAETRLRLEACWSASSSMALVDEVSAEVLGVRHLLEALDAGDPVHIARGVGQEAAKTAQLGGRLLRRRCARLLQTMNELVRTYGHAYEQAHWHIVAGTVAYQHARWREAHDHCTRAAAILRAECRGVSWETATTEAFSLSSLAHMGEIRELSRRLPLAIVDADERGDLFTAAGFRNGVPNLLWLAQDRPAHARHQADEGMARWPTTEAFQIQHYLHLIACVHADLYAGDAWAAWRRLLTAWPRLRRALFLVMESTRVELRNVRARVALACAASTVTAADPAWPGARLLRLAAQEARRIARATDLLSSRPFAAAIRAAVARTEKRDAAAAQLYAEAAQGFEAAEMRLYWAAARYREGALRGGEAGQRLQGESIAWMRSQDIKSPLAMIQVFCPEGVG